MPGMRETIERLCLFHSDWKIGQVLVHTWTARTQGHKHKQPKRCMHGVINNVQGVCLKGEPTSVGDTGSTNTQTVAREGDVSLLHSHNDQFSSLNQDMGSWSWVQFCFLIWRPNCTDLPCFVNDPIVASGQWDKKLSCCICCIKQDALHGSCCFVSLQQLVSGFTSLDHCVVIYP